MKLWGTVSLTVLISLAAAIAEPPNQHHLRARTQKNVLRAHLGVTGGTGAACPLLADDPTLPLALPKGQYTVQFDLNDLHIVSEIAFVNEGSRGTLECQVSTDGQQWLPAVEAHLLPELRASRVRFVPLEAQFLRLKFNISESGNVYSFGLFGLTLAADYDLRDLLPAEEDESEDPSPAEATIETASDGAANSVSLTITPSDATVPWVSSASAPGLGDEEALELIDENSSTVHAFAPDDPRPSVRLDLSDARRLDRVGVLYAKQPGTLTLRLLASSDSSGGATASTDSQAQHPPIGEYVYEDREGAGKFAFTGLGRRSRYIELIWEPESQPNRNAASSILGQRDRRFLKGRPRGCGTTNNPGNHQCSYRSAAAPGSRRCPGSQHSGRSRLAGARHP